MLKIATFGKLQTVTSNKRGQNIIMTKNILKIIVLLFAVFSSFSDRPKPENEICRDPAIPETYVKMYRDSVFVDSLISLIPLTKSDTTRFVSLNWDDSTETLLQKKIFQTRRINSKTSPNPRIVKFWFTRLADKTDTTKDFIFFLVLKSNDKAIEQCRFRFNSKNEMIGVSQAYLLDSTFISYDKWAADTIPSDE